MDLQIWFYVIGIVFMIVMLVIVVGIFVMVMIIKSKIDHIHKTVTDKIDKVRDLTDKGAVVFRTVKHFMGR